MAKPRNATEVHSLSEFRANASKVVRGLRRKGHSVVLTQRGREAAVLIDKGAYDSLLEELALLRDVREAEAELADGRGTSTAAAKREVFARLAR